MSINLKAITSRFGYQQITSMTSAVSLTVSDRDVNGLSAKPVIAVIVATGNDVRWRDDGVAPTASIGMLLGAGVTFQYDGDLTKIQFIETTPSSQLNISYYA